MALSPLTRRTALFATLHLCADVQNKAHRIVLGQDRYCQGILRTVNFVSVCETCVFEDVHGW